MVIIAMVLSILESSPMVFGSGYPKDTTTSWCEMLASEDVYHCFPNPWGSGGMGAWYRIPAEEGIGGCLKYPNMMKRLNPNQWILGWTVAASIPRITFDQDKYCLDSYGGSVGTTAKPGDSIDIEFKITPGDTSVADTIRGWFKAYYRGDVIDESYVPVAPKPAPVQVPRWTPAGLVLARGTTGPFDLRDLRGRSIPVRPVSHGDQVLLQPVTPLRPGLFRLRWPGGSVAFLVPGS